MLIAAAIWTWTKWKDAAQDSPGIAVALAWSTVWVIVVYPIVWVVYTLVRGPLMIAPATGAPSWYPYPFLDPSLQGGYLGVMVYVVVIAATVVAAGFLVIRVGRRRAATRESRAAVMPAARASL